MGEPIVTWSVSYATADGFACGLDQRGITSLAEAERVARETLANGRAMGWPVPTGVTHFASSVVTECRRWTITKPAAE